ncbi:hypothetical protein MA16_Dca022748 [Dendrobium catenatum]|uniref:Uncharacterized protein n=1 Tax=Dendrobium catenatum TaxID=906689 RepID=A0A2I0WJ66_9ASPA|nr:hypothetical protein MA16_Dca022748 [Dendrobium catenatum]
MIKQIFNRPFCIQGDALADLMGFVLIGQDDLHIILDDIVGNLQLLSSFEALLFKSSCSTFLNILGCCLDLRKPKGERERERERERILVGRGKFQQAIEVLCLLQEEDWTCEEDLARRFGSLPTLGECEQPRVLCPHFEGVKGRRVLCPHLEGVKERRYSANTGDSLKGRWYSSNTWDSVKG